MLDGVAGDKIKSRKRSYITKTKCCATKQSELSGKRYGDQGQFLPNATDNAKAAKINHNAVLL